MNYSTFLNDFVFLAGSSGTRPCSKAIFDAVNASTTDQWDPGGWEWNGLLGSSLFDHDWICFLLLGLYITPVVRSIQAIYIYCRTWFLTAAAYSLGVVIRTLDLYNGSLFCWVVRWRLWVCTCLLAGGARHLHFILLRAASWRFNVHCHGIFRGVQDQSGAFASSLRSSGRVQFATQYLWVAEEGGRGRSFVAGTAHESLLHILRIHESMALSTTDSVASLGFRTWGQRVSFSSQAIDLCVWVVGLLWRLLALWYCILLGAASWRTTSHYDKISPLLVGVRRRMLVGNESLGLLDGFWNARNTGRTFATTDWSKWKAADE